MNFLTDFWSKELFNRLISTGSYMFSLSLILTLPQPSSIDLPSDSTLWLYTKLALSLLVLFIIHDRAVFSIKNNQIMYPSKSVASITMATSG